MLAQSTILEQTAKRARDRFGDGVVAVLMGGMSPERPISLKTGAGVVEALRARGYRVLEVDVGRDLPTRLREQDVDVAFNCLHGTYGEDGCVQGLLEFLGIPYTHSGVRASAMALDKVTSKRLIEHIGLPTADWVAVRFQESDSVEQVALSIETDLEFPMVVKPATGGSSQGMSLVSTPQELRGALTKARTVDSMILCEEQLRGLEVTVPVVEGADGNGIALPVVAILPKEGWFDFDNKYTKGNTDYQVPAQLDEDLFEALQDLAVTCHDAHGCHGVSRVDFILDEELGPQILEINTVPGMTPTSLVPMASQEVGVDYPTLCEALLGFARLHTAGGPA